MATFALLDFGTPELLIILAILLLLFGSKKLPDLARGLGESVREVKKGIADTDDLKKEVKSQVGQTKASLSGENESDRNA